MITHALLRNTVIPFFLLLYLFNVKYKNKLDWIYILLYICTVFALPICIVLVYFGYNPLNWFIVNPWNSPYSLIEYLTFILLALMLSFYRTLDHDYSYTISIIAAGAAGYIYEVPYWLQGGVFNLFRTARDSWIILDWGMLCVPILFYMLYMKNCKLNKQTYTALLFYSLYVVTYYIEPLTVKRFIYYNLGLYPIIGIRIPGMILLLSLIYSIQRKKDAEVN